MAKQQNALPTRKVQAVALVNALVFIIAWALRDFANVTINPDVQAAFGVVLTALVGYYTPPSERDGIQTTQTV